MHFQAVAVNLQTELLHLIRLFNLYSLKKFGGLRMDGITRPPKE